MNKKPENERVQKKKGVLDVPVLGCLLTPFYLLWLFLKPFLFWLLIGLLILGVLYITGNLDRANEKPKIDPTSMMSEEELSEYYYQKSLEEAHEGLTVWDYIY